MWRCEINSTDSTVEWNTVKCVLVYTVYIMCIEKDESEVIGQACVYGILEVCLIYCISTIYLKNVLFFW